LVDTVSNKKCRLILLDGLRGIAAILVVLYHCNTVYGDAGVFFGTGYLAVDLFFILSGFVLTLAFERKFENGLGVVDFIRLRLIRLWPALTIGILLGALAHTLATPSPLIVVLILFSLIMYPILTSGGVLYPINCVQWSLAFELVANLAHVLILRRLSERSLSAICVACGVGTSVTIYFFGTAAVGSMSDNFLYGLPRLGFGYTLGILLARRWRGEPATATRGWSLSLIGTVAIVVGISLLPVTLRPIGEGVGVLLAMPLLFRAATIAKAPDSAEPWLRWLGALSYPLYAVHYPLLSIAVWMNVSLYPETPKFLWNAIGVILALVVAQAMAGAGNWWSQCKRVLSTGAESPPVEVFQHRSQF
jgi:peptidoglycan/LPS O-acetylase OafA/YrhL